MTPEQTMLDTHSTLDRLGSAFLVDESMFKVGAELGYRGFSMYLAGRFGVLGDVEADTVTATAMFLSPELTHPMWTEIASVGPVAPAAVAFNDVAAGWGHDHIVPQEDASTLARFLQDLLNSVETGGLPFFATWQRMPLADEATSRLAQLCFRYREYRGEMHRASVLLEGVRPLDAILVASPHLAELYGWEPPFSDVSDAVEASWRRAEARTLTAASRLYEPLEPDERQQFVEAVRSLVVN